VPRGVDLGGRGIIKKNTFEHPVQALRDPYLAVDMLLAPVAIGVVIGSIVSGSQEWFLTLAALIGVKWVVATMRHAVESEPRVSPHRLVPVH
jgi:hypothetical protein